MDGDYTAWASAVAAFSAVVCWTNHSFIVIMANAYRNADLSLAIFLPLRTGRLFTTKIGNLFLVLHNCNIQVDFFRIYFYFLRSRKFSHYFYLLKSRIFSMHFYFLESSKVIYFWQHWLTLIESPLRALQWAYYDHRKLPLCLSKGLKNAMCPKFEQYMLR